MIRPFFPHAVKIHGGFSCRFNLLCFMVAIFPGFSLVFITRHEKTRYVFFSQGQSENPDAASMQMRIILTTMYIETFIVQSIGTNPCSWCRCFATGHTINFFLPKYAFFFHIQRIEIVVLIAHVHMACPSLVPQVRIKDTKGVFIHE